VRLRQLRCRRGRLSWATHVALWGARPKGGMTWAPRQDSRVRGEAPQALPVEGALSIDKTSGARLRGEAPQALPVEGALSPNNGGDR
jgi:hypothetical protein